MKKLLGLLLLVLISSVLFSILFGCDKGTDKVVPTVLTTPVTNITFNSATSGGKITSDVGIDIITRGVCWNTTQNPTTANSKTNDGPGLGSFTSTLSNLTDNTTYYIRAYAINQSGTVYGDVKSFTTLNDYTGLEGTVTDIEGNVYKTIGIGSQIWMADNLKTTKYRNGDPILHVTDPNQWRISSNASTGLYCDYNNDPSNVSTYGRLYNFFTVNDSRNIAPIGWHVPTKSEVETLIFTYLGDDNTAGGMLKETGTVHWKSPNTDATNSTKFTALPGGGYDPDNGISFGIGDVGFWWAAPEQNDPGGWLYTMSYNDAGAFIGRNLGSKGCSVRCVKD